MAEEIRRKRGRPKGTAKSDTKLDDQGRYLSQYGYDPKSRKEFENKYDRIGVRLPAGAKDVINEYLATKRSEDPIKYKNLNSFIKALIEEELGHGFE